MKGSIKGVEPKILTEWWIKNEAEPTPSWSTLQNPEKDGIKGTLIEQQKHVCVYCGKRVTIKYLDAHIEHFWPSSQFSNLRFSWANLYVSCGPAREKNKPLTCGDKKGDWCPTDHIEPADPNVEYNFSYGGLGEINPNPSDNIQAKKMIEKLNLNDNSLQYQRQQIIIGLNEAIENDEIKSENIAGEIARWRSVDANGRLKSFGHIAARYLEDEPV